MLHPIPLYRTDFHYIALIIPLLPIESTFGMR
jgi:hypothetical protein